jgi:hypothetical protein
MGNWYWLVLTVQTARLQILKSEEPEVWAVALTKFFSIQVGGLPEELIKGKH